jgi:hypothetical protein
LLIFAGNEEYFIGRAAMHVKKVGYDILYRRSPSIATRAQSLFAMLVFFILIFALLAGPIWLPLVVEKLVGK